jgi:hypothetical protein
MRITPLLGAALAAATLSATWRRTRARCSPRPPRSSPRRAASTAIQPATIRPKARTAIRTTRRWSAAPRATACRARPCQACHLSRTVDLFPGTVASCQSIPGHPRWQLAPREMAWQDKSVGDICRQLKDRDRNGGRTLAMVQEHVAKDDLVAYGWAPGKGRAPAPGTQALAGELVQAWIDTGAECP